VREIADRNAKGAGQTKIGQFQSSILKRGKIIVTKKSHNAPRKTRRYLTQKQVLGFQIAMKNALAMAKGNAL